MSTHMIPRDTKGEGRILFIFSTKALIYTGVGCAIGLPVHWILKQFGVMYIGFIIIGILGLIGFSIGTFKIPQTKAFKITRDVGGDNIDDIIIRYFKFKKRKNILYVTKEEEM